MGFLELLLEIGVRVAELLVRLEQFFVLAGADRLHLGGRLSDPHQAAACASGQRNTRA